MEFLRLVNQMHCLDSMYIPKSLIREPITGVWIVDEAYKMFYQLNTQLQKEGLSSLVIVSGYRSYEYQKNLFSNKIKKLLAEGYNKKDVFKEAAKVVAPPGSSEHQLGLALDITTMSLSKREDPLTEVFCETLQGKWLFKHSIEYGFILRYPKEKMTQTGIVFEPWHYRYVGINHAKKMMKLDMCLEEYCLYYQSRSSFQI